MELDVFIPPLNLEFKYHEQQHYHAHFLYGDPTETWRKDNEKVDVSWLLQQGCLLVGPAKEVGITTNVIPTF